MSDKKTLFINGKEVEFTNEPNLLEVIKKAGFSVPTLCYRPDLTQFGACRLCVVEIDGRGIQSSCTMPPEVGLRVKTNTMRVRRIRKTVLELLLANHNRECTTCEKSGNCDLQKYANEYGITDLKYVQRKEMLPIDDSNPSIVRDPNKCILCGACVRACSEFQGHSVLGFANRGSKTQVQPFAGRELASVDCVYCGQCQAVCPTGALIQEDNTFQVEKLLADPTKFVVVNTAPAVRVSLGDEFNYPAGADVTKKMVASLRELGFDKVFDTNFGADLTIMEEATEFIERYKSGKNLPLITSCCPGWVKFIESFYPELLHLPSSCKSPTEMFGAIVKSYYAEKNHLDPKDIVVVSLMPCLAKKREAARTELSNDGYQNVDIVLTVKEYADLLKRRGIDLRELPDADFDHPLGESSGAGDIFGNTGGVIEAVARTASKWLSGEVKDVNFTQVRGLSGVREALVRVSDDISLSLCVCSGLKGARDVLEKIKRGEAHYDAIEIMACPGGCVNGGGQPIRQDMEQINVIRARQKGIYDIDKNKLVRISCDNEEIKELYHDYLIAPGSEKAHELLHTVFHDSSKA